MGLYTKQGRAAPRANQSPDRAGLPQGHFVVEGSFLVVVSARRGGEAHWGPAWDTGDKQEKSPSTVGREPSRAVMMVAEKPVIAWPICPS